jgi:putative SOS response-associated peptidase YedK
MCGRFVLTEATIVQIQRIFETTYLHGFLPSYNIAPSQNILTIHKNKKNEKVTIIEPMKWGFMPSWYKESTSKKPLINIRLETLYEKTTFKEESNNNRCLIPTSGFYEWVKEENGQKQPYYFYFKDKPAFFAGIWRNWTTPEGDTIKTCSIATTTANKVMNGYHNRMPVIITKRDEYQAWIDSSKEPINKLIEDIKLITPEEMDVYAVSKRVNSYFVNDESCIER